MAIAGFEFFPSFDDFIGGHEEYGFMQVIGRHDRQRYFRHDSKRSNRTLNCRKATRIKITRKAADPALTVDNTTAHQRGGKTAESSAGAMR